MSIYLPIQLPSRCLPYPGVKSEEVLLRPYCGEDEILLAQINPTNLERNFLTILKRVVQGLDPKQLTLGDRLYIIIWEYINSYYEFVKVKAMCSSCMQVAEFCVDLRTLDVKQLPDDFKQPQEVTLPVSKKVVQLRLLNVGDKIESERLQEKNEDSYLYECACSIVGGNLLEQMEDLKKWPTKDTARLRLFQDQMKHGPSSSKILKCPKCGAEVDVPVPFRFDFFFPTGSALRDCFGA